ncbi:hypothetical protein [Paenibacillus puerhi]|uniref:hypothetical protein n=1 Tax=Paenibacillus puerhi TaxID=2692622 RepID=UPI00135A2506|nr:hypothetical protein [Paenibacillus puerhi]
MRKKGLISLLVVLAILGGGGYMAYNYALNLAADKIAEELSSELAKNPELSGELDKLIASNLDSMVAPGKESGKPSTNSSPGASSVTPGESSRGAADGKASEGVANSGGSQSGQNSSGSQPIASGNESSSKPKSEPQFTDRQQAVKFVMGRFSASEINNIRKMASGELTPEEKAELKKIAYSKFTQAEIDAVRVAVSK